MSVFTYKDTNLFTEPMTEAPHWYTEFNQMKVQKIVFEADK